ncbi:MAG: diguanylate cyclase [Neptunomonas phycophila]|uniref:GGDEF domain-containing protein n=1 Tax=Neptunomonas phycophila TaxID=1572645 RepID=UPI003B8D8CA3
MSTEDQSVTELHQQLSLLQNLDVGVLILDREYRIRLWNEFMENHSGLLYNDVNQKNVFERFPELPVQWFKHKVDSVFLLKNRSFITWEQRPYLFKFKSYRPITGLAPTMYQNATLLPLPSPTGRIEQIAILIYDVTDTALSRQELESANHQLRTLSETDQLTGLYNRGFWENRLKDEFSRYARSLSSSALIMLDIDYFKKVNDQYGHLAGDAVLKNLAHILREATRTTDYVGRYGGEEFALLLIGTTARKAQSVVERIQELIAAARVSVDDYTITYTVSMGLTEVHPIFQTHEQWIKMADQALYLSKENGRNQMTLLVPDS